MDYWRRYVGDYMRDTTRLTMMEHGAYTLLLDHYYAEERPIPLSHEDVFRIVRAITKEERRAVATVITTYFFKASDGYHHRRADAEIAKAASARLNGRRGGRPTEAITENLDLGGTGDGTETGSEAILHPPTSNLHPPNANRHPPGSGRTFVLPDWVPAGPWDAFVELRKAMKKPLTERAKGLAVASLLKLREQGNDPGGVIEQSVLKGWTGFYPLRGDGLGGPIGGSRQSALEERNANQADDWLRKSGGGSNERH